MKHKPYQHQWFQGLGKFKQKVPIHLEKNLKSLLRSVYFVFLLNMKYWIKNQNFQKLCHLVQESDTLHLWIWHSKRRILLLFLFSWITCLLIKTIWRLSLLTLYVYDAMLYELSYDKPCLKVFVVAIPKEGFAAHFHAKRRMGIPSFFCYDTSFADFDSAGFKDFIFRESWSFLLILPPVW